MIVSEYTNYRVYPTYLLLYNQSPNKSTCSSRFDISTSKRTPNGELSDISRRKLKRAINNLVFISEHQTIKHQDHKGTKNITFKLNFITLTLPCRQLESDYQVKQKLNSFLMKFKYYGLKDYVWKAEKQVNGNIHIHLATNLYIHWSDIRKAWNSILNKSGYLLAYRKEQLNYHRFGFQVRKDLEALGWSREQQFKAYKEGMNNNWSSPNTTDVHKVQKVKNLGAYIIKYMAKETQGGTQGRLWGCSRNLLLQPENIQVTNAQMADIEDKYILTEDDQVIISTSPLLIHSGDFYAIYKLPDWWQVEPAIQQYKDRVKSG